LGIAAREGTMEEIDAYQMGQALQRQLAALEREVGEIDASHTEQKEEALRHLQQARESLAKALPHLCGLI
jgi:hypothetical protein